jgi:predicted AAA+ superfamily ATPase
MIERKYYLETIRERLKSFPVVSVLGPRQVGKTTMAQQIAGERPSHFFDLENTDALARLSGPMSALERLEGRWRAGFPVRFDNARWRRSQPQWFAVHRTARVWKG